ncbi:MAG: PAS domain S-box protein [Chitinophagaceae bacterium]
MIDEEHQALQDFKIIAANKAFAALVGIDIAQLQNCDAKQVLPAGIYNNFNWSFYFSDIINQTGSKIIELFVPHVDKWYQVEAIVEQPLFIEVTYTDITEQKKNNDLLQYVTENMFDLIALTNVQGYFTFLSASNKILGYEIDSLIGRHCLELVHPDDKDVVATAFYQMNQVNEPRSIECRYLCANGTYVWVQIKGKMLADSTGQPSEIIFSSRIITEQKKAEQQLRKLMLAVEQSPASVVITDLNGAIEYVNPKFTQLTGYTLEEVIGNNPRILKSGETSAEAYENLWNTISTGGVWTGVFHNFKKNGEKYWEQAIISGIKNEQGVITNYLAVKEDITEKKLFAEALKESEERFRTIFENNASIMYLLDANTGRYINVNQACLDFYGWDRDYFLNSSIYDINLEPDIVSERLEHIRKNSYLKFETLHKCKDGSLRNMEIFATLVVVSGRSLVHVIAHDVTERNNYFSAVENQNKILKEIAWIQSHVVRAPLARMMGLINLLELEQPNLSDDTKMLLKEISNAANEFDEIIRKVSQKTYFMNAVYSPLIKKHSD